MISVLLSLVLFCGAYFLSDFIRSKFNYLIIISILASITSFVLGFELVTIGYVGLAFFIVVMYGGAFKKTSTISKRIRSIRKEYSILGFVFLSAHALFYLVEFLSGSMTFEWIGIIAYVIMIPLFITSFNKIKKPMGMKKWKNLQNYSYVAYLLTFIHLLVIGNPEHSIAYIVVFGLYSALKLNNFVLEKYSRLKRVVMTIAIILFSNLMIFKVFEIDVVSAVSLSDSGTDYYVDDDSIENIELPDGTYTGTAVGFQDLPIELEVQIVNGQIDTINVIQDGSTGPKRGVDFEQAALDMVAEIIQEQSTAIDSISGATKTTDGIKDAVDDALRQFVD